MLAGIGRAQLAALEARVQARRENFRFYEAALGDLPGLAFMPEAPWGRHTRWLTCLTIDPAAFGADREAVRLALEANEPDRAVSIAERLRPERNPFPVNRVYHWVGYGRALARLRGRHDDAVRALRRAETIYPLRVQRDPFVREALAVLLPRTRRDSPAGQELEGMAHRSGLPM